MAGVAPARWLGDRLSDASGRVPLGRGADVPALLERGAAAPSPRGAGGVWQQILARLHSSDLATSAQLASSGGGRGAAVATILGLCLGAGGAGTYCLRTGGLPDPERLLGREAPAPRRAPAPKRHPDSARRQAPVTVAAASVRELKPAVATATPTPAPPRRARVQRRVTARRTPAPPAREPQQQEFSFENRAAAPPAPVAVAASAHAAPAARAPSATPAPPASGGGEFLP